MGFTYSATHSGVISDSGILMPELKLRVVTENRGRTVGMLLERSSPQTTEEQLYYHSSRMVVVDGRVS
jgi:hypothetical protein